MTGRKVELDEVLVEPSLTMGSNVEPEAIPVTPTPHEEEVHDKDHSTSSEVTTAELRRSARIRNNPDWFGNPVLNVMVVDNDDPATYKEAMASPDSKKC